MVELSPRTPESRQRLGRGLAALLGDSKSEPQNQSQLAGVKQIPIEFIRSNARNPRNTFDEAELDELAASIKQRGIIQPIIVRPVAGVADAYEIVAGERRWRAAQRAGQHSVPIICLQIADREALELSIVENVQRSDLNALEEARGYALLASDYGYNHSDIGRVVGKSRSHVANTLRLLALPEHTRELLSTGAISAGHARALLATDNPNAVADKIVARGLTVRDVENLNSGEKAPPLDKTPAESNVATEELARKLSLALGVEAGINSKKRTCAITIKCKDLEQVEYICAKLLQS